MQIRRSTLFAAAAVLSVLAVSAGPAGAAPAAARAVPLGDYQCWGNQSPRPLLNFTVTGSGSYRAANGKTGRFTFTPATGALVFTGYLREVMPDGFNAVYHEPQGMPTVSFRGPSGAEASFCQRV